MQQKRHKQTRLDKIISLIVKSGFTVALVSRALQDVLEKIKTTVCKIGRPLNNVTTKENSFEKSRKAI